MGGRVSSALRRLGFMTVDGVVLSLGSSAPPPPPNACELVDGPWQVLLALTQRSLVLARISVF